MWLVFFVILWIQAMSVSLPAGYIPKECDWYEREAGFTVSDLVGRICKDSDGRWWPLTLSVSNIMTPPKVTVGTVTARFQGERERWMMR